MKGKALKILVSAMCLVFVTQLLIGCLLFGPRTPVKQYEDIEIEDFVVRFYYFEKKVDGVVVRDYEDYCEIKGTTDQGNEKRFLVIPEYIDGARVESLGVYAINLTSDPQVAKPEIRSDTIEKVYFESALIAHANALDYWESSPDKGCPNLEKVMCISGYTYKFVLSEYQMVHYPRSTFEKFELDSRVEPRKRSPANVSYYYNYDLAPNDGYYWIDDCDYGGKIEFIPNDPTRDGYSFGGWYKEAECINKWDFDTDILPEEKTELKESLENGYSHLVEVTAYQETILYAKWI